MGSNNILKTHEQFIEDLENLNIHYRNGLFTIESKYINAKTPVVVNTK